MEEVAAEANALQDDNDDEAPVMDSCDEYSYEEDDEGEAIRRKSRFPRFDSEAACPTFALGMIFAGRVQFKDALIKYGLATRRHLNFPKDEKDRIRCKCSWKGCSWMIFASKDKEHFKVKTFNDVHQCPQRRDNRLVTAPRIADRFENIIRANPSWRLLNIKEAVFHEMGAEVSLSKIKRAKSIVMRRIYESCK